MTFSVLTTTKKAVALSQIRTGVMRFKVSGDNHYTNRANKQRKKFKSTAGLEPATFRLEVGRAVHCATRTCKPFNALLRFGSR